MKELFFRYWENSCMFISIDHPGSIYHIYDELGILRQKKLNRILNIKTPIIISDFKNNGIICFEQDYEKKFFWIEYGIWKNFRLNFGLSDKEIERNIIEYLKEINLKIMVQLELNIETNQLTKTYDKTFQDLIPYYFDFTTPDPNGFVGPSRKNFKLLK